MTHLSMPWLPLLAATLFATPALAAPLPAQLASLATGYSARALITAGAPLSDGTTFPRQNDLTAYFPINEREGYLLVGHELKWGADAYGGRFTRLKLRDNRLVGSQAWVSGMNLNCSGTITPWGTLLSGEEFPHKAMPVSDAEGRQAYENVRIAPDAPAASFGWIYEIRAYGETPAGQAIRRTALGRFSHESAAVVGDREVYLTEDYENGYFYKFVADRPQDLSAGKLFAFDRQREKWLPITDLTNAHIAAKATGATPFNRLEDVRLGPDGELYLAETGDDQRGDMFGRVLRYNPKTQRMEVYMEGDGKRLANPDNLVFDRHGRLLICEDQFGPNVEKYGLNELLAVDAERRVTRIATFAKGLEPTGPSFHPNKRTLFVSAMGGAKSAVMVIDGF
ncbi:MAG: PhoX family protein [Candidatus Sericytochromatia bacterium]